MPPAVRGRSAGAHSPDYTKTEITLYPNTDTNDAPRDTGPIGRQSKGQPAVPDTAHYRDRAMENRRGNDVESGGYGDRRPDQLSTPR